jgi:3-oxoacyl-[acyl-carrier protein] reductase
LDTREAFLEGKMSLVTGGTRGIGRAIARALVRAGSRVVICGRAPEPTAAAARELAAETGGWVAGFAADVRRPQEVENLFAFMDRSGGVDILINNAGVGIFRPVAELSYEEWAQVLETNLTGAFLCSHAALPRFRNAGGGFIVNIGSLAGKNPFAGGAAYNASKFGLTGFTEAMMLDHRFEGVRVSLIMPGSVSTDFGSGAASWKIAPEDVAEVVLSVLRMPARTLISRVEIRPARPEK